MRAIRLHAFGPAENLRYEEVDDPVAGPGQVRIAVAAAGLHVIDTVIRSGRPHLGLRARPAQARRGRCRCPSCPPFPDAR